MSTWDYPHLEAWGCVESVEAEAEQYLREFLSLPNILDTEVRPLDVLIKEMFTRLAVEAIAQERLLREHVGEVIDQLALQVEATRMVRNLDAPDAAVFRPGASAEKFGSQRIADRYPHHFPSPNAVEQRRCRVRKSLDPDNPPNPSGDRLIDVILQHLKASSGNA